MTNPPRSARYFGQTFFLKQKTFANVPTEASNAETALNINKCHPYSEQIDRGVLVGRAIFVVSTFTIKNRL
jgi:hypothetical protein